MTRRAEAASPRDAERGETHQEWQKRAGIESFDSWRNNGGGS